MGWQQIDANHPTARAGHTLTPTNNGGLFLFGGSNSMSQFFDELYIFEQESQSWETISFESASEKPRPRAGHCATIYNSQLVVFGGQGVSFLPHSKPQEVFYDDLYVLSVDEGNYRWHKQSTPGLPGRNAACSEVVGHYWYIFGGSDFDGPHNDVIRIDLNTFHWEILSTTGSIPCPREMHSSCVSGNSIFVLGGRSQNVIRDELYEFNTVSNTWQLHDKCLPLMGHDMVLYDKTLLIFGGVMGTEDGSMQISNTLISYDLDNLIWTENSFEKSYPDPVFAHTFTSIGADRALVLGGLNSNTALCTMHVVDNLKSMSIKL